MAVPNPRGQPVTLDQEEQAAFIIYATEQAIRVEMGATKGMICNTMGHFQLKKERLLVSDSFLTSRIKSTAELHVIESKIIARAQVDMRSLIYLKILFNNKYLVTLKYLGTSELETYEVAKRLHHIDEKGAYLACSEEQKITVPTGTGGMYIAILEN